MNVVSLVRDHVAKNMFVGTGVKKIKGKSNILQSIFYLYECTRNLGTEVKSVGLL